MKFIVIFSNILLQLQALKDHTNLYILGDSLSDINNAYTLFNGSKPDSRFYYQGRYSNGPIWPDYLNQLQPQFVIKDYAYGGATTDNDFLTLSKITPSVKDQALKVQSLFNTITDKKCQEKNNWAIVWAAGNDFIADEKVERIKSVNSLMQSVNILLDIKKIENILVFNAPSLVTFPYFSSYTDNQKSELKQLGTQYNQLLSDAIIEKQAKNSTVRLTYVDIDSIWDTLLKTPYPKATSWDPTSTCIDENNLANSTICKDPKSLFFYDHFHPTTTTHERLASEIMELFKRLKLI